MDIEEAMDDARLLLVDGTKPSPERPFVTVAIPHYKNTDFLKVSLASIVAQDIDDMEILISDDCSPEGIDDEVLEILKRSGKQFRYYRQERNLGYDGNVRFSIRLARGMYALLLGNDDGLYDETTLRRLRSIAYETGLTSVAFGNYADWSNPDDVVQRAVRTRVIGAGASVAASFYRAFSFVSGLLFYRDTAVEHETDRWDGSIYYQIYLGCRVIASGGSLATFDLPLVRKDIRIGNETVETYATRASGTARTFERRHLGLDSVMRVSADAIKPYLSPATRGPVLGWMIRRLLMTTYPFWLFEYRRVGNWSFAVGVAREMVPNRFLNEYPLRQRDRLRVWITYLVSTVLGLTIPIFVFERGKEPIAQLTRAK